MSFRDIVLFPPHFRSLFILLPLPVPLPMLPAPLYLDSTIARQHANSQLPPHMAIRNYPSLTEFPTLLRPMASMVPLQSMERSYISR